MARRYINFLYILSGFGIVCLLISFFFLPKFSAPALPHWHYLDAISSEKMWAALGFIIVIIAVWRLWPSIVKRKVVTTGPNALTPTKVVVRSRVGWYVQFLYFTLGLMALTFTGYAAYYLYYSATHEQNFGIGGLIPKSKEMVAKTYSYDPYPKYQTVYAGTIHHFRANDTCKYQGTMYWRLNNSKHVNVTEKLIGNRTYAIIVSDTDCDIELADHPFQP